MMDITGMLAVSAPFLMVVGIVWVRSQARLEEKRIAAGLGSKSEHSARQNDRIEILEDRVEVLERIITDRGYDVATQIEALRDRSGSAAGVELDIKKRH